MSQNEETAQETMQRIADEIVNYPKEYAQESPRGAAVLAAARFEDRLLTAIARRIIEVDEKTRKKLLNRTVRNLRTKIDIAYRLGLIDKNTKEGLNKVVEIRNEFAHHPERIGFCSEKVANLCRSLDTQTHLEENELRERYLHYLREVESDIQWNSTHCLVREPME